VILNRYTTRFKFNILSAFVSQHSADLSHHTCTVNTFTRTCQDLPH